MKQPWKTEDRAMERLLRGHVSQQSGPRVCNQFDPDLATAYIEHKLTTTERDGFERHMSLCAGCRTATVALGRFAEADAPVSIGPAQQANQGWRERLGSLAGAITAPRWAMAATAVLVAAVSIPIVMSRLSGSSERASNAPLPNAASVQTASQPAESAKPLDAAQTATGTVVGQSPAAGLVAQTQARNNQPPMPAGTSGGLAAPPPALAVSQLETAPAQVPAPETPVEPVEKKEQAAGAVTGQAQSLDQAAKSSPQASTPQQQTRDLLAKIDPARNKNEAEKDSAHVSVLKTGRADGEVRASDDTKIRPEDNNAPASPIGGADAVARRALAAPSSMRDGRRLSETVRARGTAERKVGKKRFWLRDEIWTDNDYKPEKEMPMVTLVRDSDVFKEVIGKRAALKGYLTAFSENERAIVVYKGTIYKLIPQDANK